MTAGGRGIILAVTGENSADVAANSFNADLAVDIPEDIKKAVETVIYRRVQGGFGDNSS